MRQLHLGIHQDNSRWASICYWINWVFALRVFVVDCVSCEVALYLSHYQLSRWLHFMEIHVYTIKPKVFETKQLMEVLRNFSSFNVHHEECPWDNSYMTGWNTIGSQTSHIHQLVIPQRKHLHSHKSFTNNTFNVLSPWDAYPYTCSQGLIR